MFTPRPLYWDCTVLLKVSAEKAEADDEISASVRAEPNEKGMGEWLCAPSVSVPPPGVVEGVG